MQLYAIKCFVVYKQYQGCSNATLFSSCTSWITLYNCGSLNCQFQHLFLSATWFHRVAQYISSPWSRRTKHEILTAQWHNPCQPDPCPTMWTNDSDCREPPVRLCINQGIKMQTSLLAKRAHWNHRFLNFPLAISGPAGIRVPQPSKRYTYFPRSGPAGLWPPRSSTARSW